VYLGAPYTFNKTSLLHINFFFLSNFAVFFFFFFFLTGLLFLQNRRFSCILPVYKDCDPLHFSNEIKLLI
jgi:hypothetical protein